MVKRTFPIHAQNQQIIRDYILQQFAQRSWWPSEGPWQAREAFEALDDSAEALEHWCKTWLNGGQWRMMRAALEPGEDSSAALS